MISLQNVGKVYRTNTLETLALNEINMNIGKGEFVSIMGPSGCGKSTLLNIMGLLDAPTSGRVVLDDLPIKRYKDKELARIRNEKIGFIFQSYHLINDLNVVDNVEIPLLYRNGLSGKERRQRAKKALERVGLSARLRHFPTQLSGGQRQRVAIARAIAGNPEVVLADEPTGNLDSRMGNEILDILTYLNEQENTTIVMVTHDESMAKRTQRIVRLYDGSQLN
ncbi:MAG: ABC transporter ATP-binding protein [Bacteroidota bacterium]